MRIAGVGGRPPATEDVASALSAAVAALGQRPAITGLRPDGRREQGFASLAGWVAKGANLLSGEFGLGPGDRVGLAGPPGWPLAAAALSAWWAGITVVEAASDGIDLAIVHVASSALDPAREQRRRPQEVLWFGDALDGTDDGVHDPAPPSGEWWAEAVIPHPDRPPTPAQDGSLVALVAKDGSAMSQRGLLARIGSDDAGAVGLVRVGDQDVLERVDAAVLLATLALRPLVTGSATVVIEHSETEREHVATAERIARWYD
jgi:uncharacterized protein (TIGR03089 family)